MYTDRLACVAVIEIRYQPLPTLAMELLTALKPELDPAEDWVTEPLPVKLKTVETQSLVEWKNRNAMLVLPFGLT